MEGMSETARRRCCTVCHHVQPRRSVTASTSTPAASASQLRMNTARGPGREAEATSNGLRPVALLIFDMQPEQEAEGMVEHQWLPAAGGALDDLAEVAIACTPEEVSTHLADGLHPEIVFLFAETGWGYESLRQHKAALLDSGLRWIQAASSGAEKLCPIWLGTNVTCTNGAGIYASSLAEFVLAGILHFSKHFPRLAAQRRTATWQMRDDASVPPQDIEGKSVLIAGYGATGKATARLCRAFGMRTVGVKRSIALEDFEHVDELIAPEPKPALLAALADADFVVCTLPKTDETHHFFAAEEFAAMKTSAVFLNIGRGDNVDEKAMINALSSGEFAACCLDVFDEEPLPASSPLWSFSDDQVLLSPVRRHCVGCI
jgi:phosphoglycerate dehydrogenase-like enzyme